MSVAHFSRLVVAPTLAMVAACAVDSPTTGGSSGFGLECSIPTSEIHRGQRRDGLPALSNPRMAAADDPFAAYLEPGDRVVGVVLDGEPIAIPLNIFWWHEIVNLDGEGYSIAVTHCPLTGSSLAFDRAPLGGVEFGVSGLLYRNNLIMYDRSGDTESLWPQLLRGARCGARDGTALTMVPIIEMSWRGWSRLYPGSRIVTADTGHNRDYRRYPYGDYDRTDNDFLLFPQSPPIDTRRPPKERVLGIPDGNGGVAFPLQELVHLGEAGAIHGATTQGAYVVFWNQFGRGAMAYRPETGGHGLTFVGQENRIVDAETGSEWNVHGVAVAGPLAGEALEPIAEAFVAFWFAWSAFHPDTYIWTMP